MPVFPLPAFDPQLFTQLKAGELKQQVGNSIYQCIISTVGDEKITSKITGMLLEESTVNQQLMMSDVNYFNKNIHDAWMMLLQNK